MKKSAEVSNQQINKVIKELLDVLKERPRDILDRRFGLNGQRPLVLGKIGDDFGITRERVRQVESDSFKKLREAKKSSDFKSIERKALKSIEEYGGFCEKLFLKKQIKENIDQKQINQLMFILNSSSSIIFKKGKLDMKGFWIASKDSGQEKKVVQAHDFILKYIKDRKSPVTIDDIFKELESSEEWKEFFSSAKGEKKLRMVLRISRLVDRNILEEWGLKNWKIISQRGAKEKAYIVLRKQEKPLHFRDITNFINKSWKEKKALPQTVHNELIKDRRFVLIGRGIYGLRDWGFPEGTVREIICYFLEQQDSPIHRDKIVEHVLEKKQVKKTTVLVTLADRSFFHKDEQGFFMVKK